MLIIIVYFHLKYLGSIVFLILFGIKELGCFNCFITLKIPPLKYFQLSVSANVRKIILASANVDNANIDLSESNSSK